MVGRILGKGAFGKVNLAVHKLSGKLVAIKSMHKEYLASDNNNEKFKNEITLLRLLRHKNIMSIYETFSTDSYLVIIMELCSGGDLLTYVRKYRKIPESLAKITFKQLLEGLSYCHSKSIIHRDIKLDNILLDEYGHVKIGDFGVSRKVGKDKMLTGKCGTPIYIAPEILKCPEGYNGEKVDIWSAGVVLYAMVYGDFPFKGNTVEEVEECVMIGKYELPEDVSKDLRDLLKHILEPNPNLRIPISDIMSHPWMEGTDSLEMIFSTEEILNLKKEYNIRLQRDNSVDSSMTSSIFTEHELNDTGNEFEEDSNLNKSFVLGPFNSIEQDSGKLMREVEDKIINKKILKFESKLREYNRRYERDNNSKLDNGIYLNTELQINKNDIISKSKVKNIKSKAITLILEKIKENKFNELVLIEMKKMGFERTFVITSLRNHELNCATTLYYLLLSNNN